jgi:YEATS domain-containing protein 4
MSTDRIRAKVCTSLWTPILLRGSFSLQGLSIYRPIIYGNTAHVLTPEEREAHPSREHTHRWTVAVRSAASAEDSDIVGGADDLSYFIRRVTFKLHETYPNPSRSE